MPLFQNVEHTDKQKKEEEMDTNERSCIMQTVNVVSHSSREKRKYFQRQLSTKCRASVVLRFAFVTIMYRLN